MSEDRCLNCGCFVEYRQIMTECGLDEDYICNNKRCDEIWEKKNKRQIEENKNNNQVER